MHHKKTKSLSRGLSLALSQVLICGLVLAPAVPVQADEAGLPLDQVLSELMKYKPEDLQAHLEKIKAQSAEKAAQAKALTDQAAAKAEQIKALQAEIDQMNTQAQALTAEAAQITAGAANVEMIVGALKAQTDAAAAKVAADAKAAEDAKAKEMAAAKAAEEAKAKEMAAAKAAEEMKAKEMAAAKAAEEKKAAEMAAAKAAEEMKAKEMAAAPAAEKITFVDHMMPIFMAKCASCHNQDKAKGGFAIDNYAKMMMGGGSGEVIVPGDASASRLYRMVTHEEEPTMPMNSAKLDDATLAKIKAWIDGGALENKSSTFQAKAGPDTSMDTAAAPKIVVDPDAIPIPTKMENIELSPLEGALAIRAIASSPVAPVVAISGYRQVLMYNAETLELLSAVSFPEGTAESLRFSPNGSLLVVAGGEGGKLGLAAVYDVVSGARLGTFGMTFDTVLTADITLDHTQIALGGTDKKVRVYSTADGSKLYEIDKHTDWVQSVRFSPDGWFLATADRAGGMFTWIAENGRDIHELRGHGGAINALDFRPDSNVLASASADGEVMLWEMSDGKRIKNWKAHAPGVLSVDFAADARLVTSGVDNTTRLWKADGGKLKDYPALSDWAYAACFAANDTRVVTGSWTGEIKVYDTNEASELGTMSVASNTP